MAEKMIIKTYKQALDYVLKTIPKGEKRYPGDVGVRRQKLLLKNLGNPQNKVKVIHVAGTSGKGSVVSYLSTLLKSQGFKVGTTVSPHILDIRERIQIDNRMISKKEFVDYLNQIIPAIEMTKAEKIGSPTYFELMIALAFWVFNEKKVDYAVVETGMGGLMDGTNTVENENKIAVITRLGLDHTSILGKKIIDIAFQKAGIIQKKNMTVALWQSKKIREVLDREAQKKLVQIEYVKKEENYKKIGYNDKGLVYNFKFKNLEKINLNLNNYALYQIENSALALTVLEKLSQRDNFELNLDLIRKTIGDFKFVGRMEILQKQNKTMILDGAHNPQKMKSFIDSLKKAFPNQKFIFVIAFRQRKDFSKMLKMMIPMASSFIFTSFVVRDEDMIQISQAPKDMTRVLERLKYKNYKVILNPKLAVEAAKKESDKIVITSSLYLLRKIYFFLKTERK
jgi:dihydrofolate synthase/folylpolyglutamate synthase